MNGRAAVLAGSRGAGQRQVLSPGAFQPSRSRPQIRQDKGRFVSRRIGAQTKCEWSSGRLEPGEAPRMNRERPHLLGMELYFEDLSRAREFYLRVLGLDLKEEAAGHFARFDGAARSFVWRRKERRITRPATKR